MKKFLFVAGIAMLVFLAMTSQTHADLGTNLTIYYQFEDGSVWLDSENYMNATNQGTDDNASGKIGNAAQFVAANEDIANITSKLFDNNTDWSINMWVKYSSNAGLNEYLFRNTNGSFRMYTGDAGDDQKIYGIIGSGNFGYSTVNVGNDSWHMVTVTYNSSDQVATRYIDNTVEIDTISSVTQINTSGNFTWGYGSTSTFIDGLFDEIGIWHQTLTVDDIDTLWNGGDGYNYSNFGTSANDTLNITSISPADNYEFAVTEFTVNATVSSNQTFNCSWYQDGIFNTTITGLAAGASTTASVNYTFTEANGLNHTYYWFCDNGIDNETSATNSFSYNVSLDNCSVFTTRALNFTITDEGDDTNISGDMSYRFTWDIDGVTGIYNGSGTGSHFDFCINPAYANFTSDIHIQYESTGYDARDWIKESYVTDNVTDLISLYLLASGNSTEVTIHVVDDKDDDLENILIEAQLWDIVTDTYEVVEMEYTDSEGNAIFDIVQGTEYYRFLFYQDGELAITTDKFKIFTTSLEYIISAGEVSRFATWLQLDAGITRSPILYNNNTNIINWTWNDPSSLADTYCLKVFGNGTNYTDSCLSSSSGTINYTITYLNHSYTAVGYVTVGGRTFTLETLGIPALQDWQKWGADFSIAISLIVFLTVALMGLVNKNLSIVSAILALVVLQFFGLLPISILGVMGLVVLGIIMLVVINKR